MQRQPKCAETWTSPTSTLSTAADSKSWTGFPCGMEPNWPSTPSWSPRAADHDGAALEVARRQGAHVPQNLLGKGVGHGWFWQFEVGRSNEESATFLAALANARAGSSPSILQGKVDTKLIRLWSAMLACSAALAFERRLCSTAVQCQAPGESSRLCTRSCGMHDLPGLPVRLPQCFCLPIRLKVPYTDDFPLCALTSSTSCVSIKKEKWELHPDNQMEMCGYGNGTPSQARPKRKSRC